jgi:hypothetical protein
MRAASLSYRLPYTRKSKKKKKKKNVGPANTVEVDKARSVWALSFLYRFSLKKKKKRKKNKILSSWSPPWCLQLLLNGKKKKKKI